MESKTMIRVNLVDGNKHVFEMTLEQFEGKVTDTDKSFGKKLYRIEEVLINPEHVTSVVQFEKKPVKVRNARGIY
ncbi:hypothetical protein [Bacillus wiedmannii]|uniref:DUF2187 domain-containing protein n=1 Tax=Bacillus wiedmannii TaxID=1890302 RepID=A0ABD6TQV0_9BACI|nr:hypothetical protein [Bacillus wiedmannii]PEI81401.1 hypothetical protein CN905_02230 [Bacillus wiedmannii]PEN45175.1 hypothetical protein CN630_19115 [Bacillus wiedmannii]PEO61738.1 hypothetical protein CN560_00520 [Bacillus wiedmannii]PEO75421.1 hypothetical protein CN572_02805 [Bacillus wiedmannii]PFX63386.1 hypothetical protein COL36_04305 [Bacillus wiedmannii]